MCSNPIRALDSVWCDDYARRRLPRQNGSALLSLLLLAVGLSTTGRVRRRPVDVNAVRTTVLRVRKADRAPAKEVVARPSYTTMDVHTNAALTS